jgi:CubicO group peptidase (beta-lactamase class C family)
VLATALAAVASAPLAVAAQAVPPASPGHAELGAAPNALALAADSLFAFAGSQDPGCAVGVARPGAPTLLRAYGLADLAHGVAITPETVFESGSVAKQFTAAAVLLLAQDGRLSLDDDVRRHLPEVPDFGRRITLRHLLTHTSGLRDQWQLLAIAGNPPGTQVHTLATVLDLVSRQRALNFPPGAEFLYTNTGYSLAALVVERAGGRPFTQFTEERLFRPLGMTRTRWRDDFRRVVPGRATAYGPVSPPGPSRGSLGYREDMPFTSVVGNGGLLTTVGDLLRWNAFLDAPAVGRDGGGVPNGPALVAGLETAGRLASGRVLPYALGLDLDTAGGVRTVSHGGSTAGYKTWLGRAPARGVSVAVLCNHGGANAPALGAQLAARALAAPGGAARADVPGAARPGAAAPPPRTTGAAANAAADARGTLATYAGVFWSARAGAVVRTAVADGRLTLHRTSAVVLTPDGPHRFRLPEARAGEYLEFVPAGSRARELRVVDGADTVRLAAMPLPDTTARLLAAYAGTYRSAELDVRITVALRNGALVWRQPFGVERPLRAVFADGFTAPLRGTTTVVFTRDRSGRVDGLGMWAAAVRDLRFVRE